MNGGEFYSSREQNYIGENKSFPAEIYRKPTEENPLGVETPDAGREVTSLQKKRIPKKEGAGAKLKDVMDRFLGGVRGAAVSMTVAVSAVAVIGTAVATEPAAEMMNIEVGADYVEYEIDVRDLDPEKDYYLVLSAPACDPIETEVESDGIQSVRTEGLRPEWEYTLTLEGGDGLFGRTTHFKYKFQTGKLTDTDPPDEPPIEEPPTEPPDDPTEPPPPEPPNVTVSEVSVIGLDRLRIEFVNGGEQTFDLLIGYPDGTEQVITPYPSDIERGYVELSVTNGATALSIAPTVDRDGVTVVGEPLEKSFGTDIEIEAVVVLDNYYKEILFIARGMTGGAEMIYVTSSESEEQYYLYLDGYMLRDYYSTRGEITYTMYLGNEDGEQLSNVVELTVDTTDQTVSGEYNANLLNPADVGVTFNPDGTMNAYMNIDFSSEDEAIFYVACLGDYYVKGREPIAVFGSVPDRSYGISTYICREIDGVIYAITFSYPSGSVNENYVGLEWEITEDGLCVYLSDSEAVDLDSFRVVGSDGSEIALSSSDFVYDEQRWMYSADVLIDTTLDYIDILVEMDIDGTPLLEIDEYVGSLRRVERQRIYPNTIGETEYE